MRIFGRLNQQTVNDNANLRRQFFEDLPWALLNGREFLFNHEPFAQRPCKAIVQVPMRIE